MSKEALDQFIQKVTDDEELQARIGEEMDINAFITLGAEQGCEFSAEDLAKSAELSDEELDRVTGGSPDLTHVRQVFAGENLVNESRQIYEDPRYYLALAQYNELDSVRELKVGKSLTFPPLDR